MGMASTNLAVCIDMYRKDEIIPLETLRFLSPRTNNSLLKGGDVFFFLVFQMTFNYVDPG